MPSTLEELEFERNRQEILKRSRSSLQKNNTPVASLNNGEAKGNKRFAWEYELEVYREQKKRERFYKIGAWCGIVSLLLTLAVNFKIILSWIGL